MPRPAEIIRGAGADGFTWSIDAHAKHASELSVGKIAFVTGRCVGRILKVDRAGDELKLVLGPAELTEIFRRLEIHLDQPVDFQQALTYPALQLPNTQFPLETEESLTNDWTAQLRTHQGLELVALQSGPGVGILPRPYKMDLQTTKPLSNADGVGMEFVEQGQGIRAVVQVQLKIQQPRLEAHVSINNGKLDATVILHNASGLRIAFDSAVAEGFPGKVNWYMPAGQLSFPLGGPVPLAFDIRQDLFVTAVYAARGSSFNAGGKYDFNGDIGFKVQSGNFSVFGPKGFKIQQDLNANMTGVSIAPREFALRHVITSTVGLGAAGFTIGPQLRFGTRIEVKKGSDVALVDCRGTAVSMGVQGGVGWTIPRVVAKLVNLFLKVIRAAPVADYGGFHSD